MKQHVIISFTIPSTYMIEKPFWTSSDMPFPNMEQNDFLLVMLYALVIPHSINLQIQLFEIQ